MTLKCPFCLRRLRAVTRRGLLQLLCRDHGQITRPSVEIEDKEGN